MRALWIALMLEAAGCVTARSGHRCPGGAVVRCLTTVVCETDRRRACEVCRCSDAPYPPAAR